MARRDYSIILKDLTRYELETLIAQANKRLNEIKRIYLREITKGCYDYIYATWQEDGKTMQKLLGQRTITPNEPNQPNYLDYVITQKQADRFKDNEDYYELVTKHELNDHEFEEFYGIPQDEDKLDRPTNVLIHMGKYKKACLEYESLEKIANSPYSKYGVNSLKGIAFLNRMIETGHEVFCTYNENGQLIEEKIAVSNGVKNYETN